MGLYRCHMFLFTSDKLRVRKHARVNIRYTREMKQCSYGTFTSYVPWGKQDNHFPIFTVTNKYTIISHIIKLLHVSTLLCHPQGTCNQYLANDHMVGNRRCVFINYICLINCRTQLICGSYMFITYVSTTCFGAYGHLQVG